MAAMIIAGSRKGNTQMKYEPIRLEKKLSQFEDHWAPRIIASMNNYHFKVVKFQGNFIWHKHDTTDEVFIVLDGEMTIAFRDGSVKIGAGEMFVVPKCTEHRPSADQECKALLVEPAGTINTGDAGGAMTADNNVWI